MNGVMLYYVRRDGGLFPAPVPESSTESKRACDLFRVLGIFLAKVLQDGRLVDLPFAPSFLKVIASSQVITLACVNTVDKSC
ncbi:unnamed protein product [Gongylonema pulchrum]|uniref:E3 ubiquitin-protein ligase n=1 Tax=Gongylonema pulchrum TaxID=637853 RepID=A0A183DH49_9BILA|nr:unnamed protein product [Gongylonema pulchrum]